MFVEGKKCMQHLETFNLKAKESVIMRLELSRKKIPSTTNITYKKLDLSLTVLSVTFSTMAANAGIEAVRTDLQCHSKLKKKQNTHTLNCHRQHRQNLASETDDILLPQSSTIQKCWLVYSRKTELTFVNLKPM